MKDKEEKVIWLRPVEKEPKRKFYLYTKRFCEQCGSIHLYKKIGNMNAPNVHFGCGKYNQLALCGEEAEFFQPTLFGKG